MGRVRIKKNELPKIIRRLPSEVDHGVDRAGDELAPMIYSAVRHDTGASASTTKNRTPGALHTAVGIGIRQGTGFYVRFWEWGTSRPNLYGIVVPAEGRVKKTSVFFEPIFAGRIAQDVRRAVT